MGRLRALPLPIAMPETYHSRWPAEQLTFVYTRSRPEVGLYGCPLSVGVPDG